MVHEHTLFLHYPLVNNQEGKKLKQMKVQLTSKDKKYRIDETN